MVVLTHRLQQFRADACLRIRSVKLYRNASITSAINRGIRRTAAAHDAYEKRAHVRRTKNDHLRIEYPPRADNPESIRLDDDSLRVVRVEDETPSLEHVAFKPRNGEDAVKLKSDQVYDSELEKRFKNAGARRDRVPEERRASPMSLKTQGRNSHLHSPEICRLKHCHKTRTLSQSTEPTSLAAKAVSESDGQRGETLAQPGRLHALNINVPLSIPYTTASSEFLYGTFVVKAALQARRRMLHKLYICNGVDQRREVVKAPEIHQLALDAGVPVSRVGREWYDLLSKMSGQRPHNGYILEAAPLPRLPTTSMLAVPDRVGSYRIRVGNQTAQDLEINRKAFGMVDHLSAKLPSLGSQSRFPFIVLLDGILWSRRCCASRTQHCAHLLCCSEGIRGSSRIRSSPDCEE